MNANQFDNNQWRTRAACRGLPVDMFIPEARGQGQPIYADARKVCGACIVRKACLAYALENHEELGMWGGTTPKDRQKLGYGPWMLQCDLCGNRVERTSRNQKYCSRACGLTALST